MTLEEGKREKINWIKWVIEFCNTDLEAINEKEKFILTFTLDTLFYPIRSPQQVREELSRFECPSLPDTSWEEIPNVQGTLKFFLNEIIKAPEEKETRIWKIPVTFTPSFAVFGDGSCKVAYTPSEINDKFLKARLLSYRDYGVPVNFPVDITNFPLDIKDGRLSSLNEPNYLGWFVGILDGITTNWIGKCPGCGRFFLNPSKRGKIYCNTSCDSRSIVIKNREDLKKDQQKYQAYLKKQKIRMRKRYKEMRRALLGPKVRVGRKPKKGAV